MQISNMTTRQKVTIGLFVVVIIFLVWQVMGLFGNRGSSVTQTAANRPNAKIQQPQMITPKQATLPKPPVMTEREMALLKLQQQTEEKYIAALNELQMLKITRDIAEVNKAIAAAKLDTVTAQKNTIDLLTKPALPQGAYAQGLAGPIASVPPVSPSAVPAPVLVTSEASYIVISVSELQHRWGAVLGYQGKLYNVSIGDILPADGSRVVSINKSGVMLEKEGVKKKVSLVPII